MVKEAAKAKVDRIKAAEKIIISANAKSDKEPTLAAVGIDKAVKAVSSMAEKKAAIKVVADAKAAEADAKERALEQGRSASSKARR